MTLLAMACSAAALVLAVTVFVSFDMIASRKALLEHAQVQADVIGANSSAAIVFEDAEAATETLAALASDPTILAGEVFDVEGQRLAAYYRAGSDIATSGMVTEPGHVFKKNRLTVTRVIRLDGDVVGRLVLTCSLDALTADTRNHILIALVVMIIAMAVAFLLSKRLQQAMDKPIQHLAQIARRVADHEDYSIRATRYSHDEFGVLTDSINIMLCHRQGHAHRTGPGTVW